MSTQHDNPQAFPELRHIFRQDHATMSGSVIIEANPGMTLREWYAGQALAGLCAAHANPAAIGFPNNYETAEKAWMLAGSMMEARQSHPAP